MRTPNEIRETGAAWISETELAALLDALEAANAEVEKAHAAMAHWLGEANRLEAELADLRIENQQLREAYGE